MMIMIMVNVNENWNEILEWTKIDEKMSGKWGLDYFNQIKKIITYFFFPTTILVTLPAARHIHKHT